MVTTSNTSKDPEVSMFSIAGAAGIAESDAVLEVVTDNSKLLLAVLMFLTGYG